MCIEFACDLTTHVVLMKNVIHKESQQFDAKHRGAHMPMVPSSPDIIDTNNSSCDRSALGSVQVLAGANENSELTASSFPQDAGKVPLSLLLRKETNWSCNNISKV